MDGFAESMIARGPTLGADRETATGSLHVLALPSVVAARDFIALEPNNRAGVYGEHLVWRFENLLGRSMWEFSGQAAEQRFLIIGRSHLGRPVPAEILPPELLERLVLYGALTTLDGAERTESHWPFRRRIAKLSVRSWMTSERGSTRSPR